MLIALAALALQSQSDYLVVDGLLIGALGEAGWVKPRDWPRDLKIPFAKVAPEGGSAAFVLTLGKDASAITADGNDTIGVFFSGKSWYPRTPVVSLNRESAMDLAAQFARNRGIPRPRPYLTGVWDVDLDGDGDSEQIIEAVSHPRVRRGQPLEGDWQAVLLHWRGGNQSRLFPLHCSFPKAGQDLAECQLRAIADFEGDGRLEVITTSKQPSMFSATLWSFVGGKLIPTLDASYQVDALSLR